MAKERSPDGRKHIKTDGIVVKKGSNEWSDASQVEWVNDALVVLTQAYSHRGHPLISDDNPTFGGFPGVHLKVRANGTDHDVYLSPIHGHHARVGGDDIPDGTRTQVLCPVSGEELPEYEGSHTPSCPGRLRTLYLTPKLTSAHVAVLCEMWGCQSSRVVDEFEILSEFVDTMDAA